MSARTAPLSWSDHHLHTLYPKVFPKTGQQRIWHNMFISFTCCQMNSLRTVVTIIVLIFSIHLRAQTVSGTVMSGETKLPLTKATITNLNSIQSTTTNKQGVYFI